MARDQITIEDLSEQQRNFVIEWVARGARRGDATLAMRAVNPDITPESARQTASRYQRDPRILEAMKNLADASVRGGAVASADLLAEVVETGMAFGQKVPVKDILRCAQDLLNRAGLQSVTRHEIDVTDNRSLAELKAAVQEKLNTLGFQEQKVIDAEAEEVYDPAAPWGRKKDGTPRGKPGTGRKKLQLTPPKPKDPAKMTEREKVLHASRQRAKEMSEKMRAKRRAAKLKSMGREV